MNLPPDRAQELLKDVRVWFDDFVGDIIDANAQGAKPLGMKLDHTLRVLEETELLCPTIEGTESIGIFGMINALVHDIGRFEQYVKYGTFADHKSCNHAELSVDIITRDLLPRYDPDIKDHLLHLTITPVALHNRVTIPDEMKADSLLLTRLLRDADKIDILRTVLSVIEGKADVPAEDIFLGLSGGNEISDRIYDSVMEGQPVKYSDMRYRNDFIVLQLGWAFDIHFNAALKRICDTGLLEGLSNHLPQGGKRKRLENRIFKYIEERLNR